MDLAGLFFEAVTVVSQKVSIDTKQKISIFKKESPLFQTIFLGYPGSSHVYQWDEEVDHFVAFLNFLLVGFSAIWEFPKIGVPPKRIVYNGKPIKMDDLGIPLFLETPILPCWQCRCEKNHPF